MDKDGICAEQSGRFWVCPNCLKRSKHVEETLKQRLLQGYRGVLSVVEVHFGKL